MATKTRVAVKKFLCFSCKVTEVSHSKEWCEDCRYDPYYERYCAGCACDTSIGYGCCDDCPTMAH